MSVYVRIRSMMLTHKDLLLKTEQLERRIGKQEEKTALVFIYLKKFIDVKEKGREEEIDFQKRKRIGFRPDR